jgi:NAD+ kinase
METVALVGLGLGDASSSPPTTPAPDAACQRAGRVTRAAAPHARSVPVHQLGLVVHPTRRIEPVLEAIRAGASANGLAVGQVSVPGQTRRVADQLEAADCDLLLAIGGDGTALSALHLGAPASRPVLAVACGSIGMLTTVDAGRVTWALDQIANAEWTPVALPGLEVAWDDEHAGVAINDVAVVRDSGAQIAISIAVDSELYARVAGDGLVVATPLGSSAYTMAAGGPLLAPGAEGVTVTPLAPHGGSVPPLVAGSASRLTLTIEDAPGTAVWELDGRRGPIPSRVLTVRCHGTYATLVRFDGDEPRLAGLRRRDLVRDSPRVLVGDESRRRRASGGQAT